MACQIRALVLRMKTHEMVKTQWVSDDNSAIMFTINRATYVCKRFYY
jgi:hypothetical protein